jgi:tape measure domain-containing protein
MADTKMEVLIELKDEMSSSLKKIKDGMGEMEQKFSKAADASKTFAVGVTAVATAAGGLAYSALKAAAGAEQTKVAFETMLGSAQQADAFIRKLNDFAKTTPFELKNLETASKQLLAYGSSADDVFTQLRSLGNIASGVGTDKMPQLIMAFGQVQAATKLTGSELRQFTEAGVPLLGTLAKQFGKTAAEIQDMVSDGKIGFKDVEAALASMSGEGGKFNNLMEKQSQTLGGMISNLSDAWDLFLRGQGAKLIDFGKQLVTMILNLIQNVLPKWIEKINELGTFLEKNRWVLAAVAGVIVGGLVPAVLSAALAF